MYKTAALSLIGVLLFLNSCNAPPRAGEFKGSQSTLIINNDSVSLKVPSAGWKIDPVSVYEIDANTIWIIYRLEPPSGFAAQVISESATKIRFYRHRSGYQSELPPPVITQFVLGKTWAWNSNPEIRFIPSLKELEEDLKNAKSLRFSLETNS